MDGEGPTMGKDAELNIKLRNKSSEKRTVVVNSQVGVMYYTGVLKAVIRKDNTDLEVPPNNGEWGPEGGFQPVNEDAEFQMMIYLSYTEFSFQHSDSPNSQNPFISLAYKFNINLIKCM